MPSFAEYIQRPLTARKLPLFALAGTHRLVLADTFEGCLRHSVAVLPCHRGALSVFCSVRDKSRTESFVATCGKHVPLAMCACARVYMLRLTRERGIEQADKTAAHQSSSSGSKQRLYACMLFD